MASDGMFIETMRIITRRMMECLSVLVLPPEEIKET